MTARIGSAKTGGRRKGSLDKAERQLVTAEMANDLLLVYRKLGGAKWLLEFARENPGEFIRQGLSRLFPSPQKDPDVEINIGPSANNMTERDAAIRVAFALSKAVYESDPAVAERVPPLHEPEPLPMTPQQSYQPPVYSAPLVYPAPVEDRPDKDQWVQEIGLSEEQKRNNRLVEATKAPVYGGSAAEQGLAVRRSRRSELL